MGQLEEVLRQQGYGKNPNIIESKPKENAMASALRAASTGGDSDTFVPPEGEFTGQNANEWSGSGSVPDHLLPPSLGGTASQQDLKDAGLWEAWVEFYSKGFGGYGGGVGPENPFYDYTGYGGGELAPGGSQPGAPPGEKHPGYGGSNPDAPVDEETEEDWLGGKLPQVPIQPGELWDDWQPPPDSNFGPGDGVSGIDPGYDLGEGGDTWDLDPFNPDNQFGFEGSSNAKFYQMQAAAQRAQGFRNAMREQMAGKRAVEAAKERAEFEYDPAMAWEWAGGSDRFKPQISTGEKMATHWQFDADNFGDMNAGDIWSMVQDRNVFDSSDSSKSQRDVLNNIFNDPNRAKYLNDFNFADYGSANEAFAALNDDMYKGMNRPNVAKEGMKNYMKQLYTGVAGEGGGYYVPAGYAMPINWATTGGNS